MARLSPIAIAVGAVVAGLLSGCGNLSERLSSPPPTFPGLVSCGPTYLPGWYVYPPHNYCYPAYAFVGVYRTGP
jgi:hypothetical protein